MAFGAQEVDGPTATAATTTTATDCEPPQTQEDLGFAGDLPDDMPPIPRMGMGPGLEPPGDDPFAALTEDEGGGLEDDESTTAALPSEADPPLTQADRGIEMEEEPAEAGDPAEAAAAVRGELTPEEVLLLVDAANGFNNLSRYGMLWTCRHRCAKMSRFAFNCYRH